MTLSLTNQEKNELKDVIRDMMVQLRDRLTEAITTFNEESDEDMDCCTYETSEYPTKMYFLMHLYDPETTNSSPREFWKMDTGDRSHLLNMLEIGLSPCAFSKILQWLNDKNKE